VFVEEYLQDLRRDRYAPRAWGAYARRVAARVREDLVASPSAVRSIGMLALAYFAAAFVTAGAMSLAWDRALAYAFLWNTGLWMLGAFLFVTLFVGLLRDPRGYRLSAVNVPIALTLLRVALVPGITLFLVERHFVFALVTYVVAALSDVADGWIARRWGQITPLGTVLDPLVDIVFNLAMLAGLSAAGLLADWVFWLGVLRYGILTVGAAGLYLFVGPVRIQPTSFGRATGVVMSVFIALFTLLVAVRGEVAEALAPLTEGALGLLLAATVVQVIALGWYNLRVMSGANREGRVVGDVRWGRS
jgi:phosphatidylglycerophosphate synthase